MKNLACKILKVMEEIESVSKDGFNSFHKYKYVTDAAIVAEIRKALIKNKLLCIPKQLSCVQANELTTLQVEYTLFDADSGEEVKTTVYGYGQDKGDKGIYKAATGAEKYFLLKTFLLPTDDDPEKENGKQQSQGRPSLVTPPLDPDENPIETITFVPIKVDYVKSAKGTYYHKIYDPEGVAYMCFEAGMAMMAVDAQKQEINITLEYRKQKFGLRVVSVLLSQVPVKS